MEATPSEEPAAPVRALIVTGGDGWRGPLPRFGAAIGTVIAADSGVELALRFGLPVAVVVGDMDSASPADLEEAEQLGARIERHPRDKDETDLELALDLARSEGATEIVVVGGSGGRLSHLLAIAFLLTSDKYEAITIRWLLPNAEAHVVNRLHRCRIDGNVGDLVSLLPIGGPVSGIHTDGLKWVLHDSELEAAEIRGISNEMESERANVAVVAGTLLVIHEPGEESR